MNTANERIRYLRKHLENLTLEKFGERLGVGKSAISDIERGRNNPTEQMIKSIRREFGVSEDWLRRGEGEPYIALTREEALANMIADAQKEPADSIKNRLFSIMAKLDEEDWIALARIAQKILNE